MSPCKGQTKGKPPKPRKGVAPMLQDPRMSKLVRERRRSTSFAPALIGLFSQQGIVNPQQTPKVSPCQGLLCRVACQRTNLIRSCEYVRLTQSRPRKLAGL